MRANKKKNKKIFAASRAETAHMLSRESQCSSLYMVNAIYTKNGNQMMNGNQSSNKKKTKRNKQGAQMVVRPMTSQQFSTKKVPKDFSYSDNRDSSTKIATTANNDDSSMNQMDSHNVSSSLIKNTMRNTGQSSSFCQALHKTHKSMLFKQTQESQAQQI